MGDDKPKLTREEARALVESGFMPLKDYLEMFEADRISVWTESQRLAFGLQTKPSD